ncbi:uncharacterized protein LOC116845098 [Odontomachus brunneus]|uniref:uncharacterized protein LOC116845098 n=1 Tax=Odontomachus brunneus TaxID=486640 RepID=UPI0013F1BEE3|nr:uncharacterized protein LOC116845098 [Odontomachus brunneus]XP_032673308.1 uncharacterized protein LOC116845098 [Odontomachus brunneus]
MLVLPLIPFFLGYKMPDIFNPMPSYIFYMRVNTLLINKSEIPVKESNAGLQFYLKCQSYKLENLKCHIPENITNLPKLDSIQQVEKNFFTLSSLQFSGIRFRMEFDVKGVKSYRILVKNVKNKETLLKVYQFIGDQLSVGAYLSTRGLEFTAIEETIIGKCPTHYEINRIKALSRSEIELVSFLASHGYELNKDEALFINKTRRVDECYPNNNYILGKILWTDLITSNDTEKLKESQTVMSFGHNEYYSKTVNMFYLYNEQDEIAGYVQETINFGLEFIQG